jgi:hypothetical protein
MLEWIWEAVRFIGTENIYLREYIKLAVSDNVLILPSYIQEIRTISLVDGTPLIETRNKFKENTLRNPQYIVNGRQIIFNNDASEVIIESLIFPTDEEGMPYIYDNVYFIEAITTYILYKLARREWIKNNLTTDKYREMEADWLFSVAAAVSKMQIPTIDGMRELMEIHDLSLGFDGELGKKVSTVSNYNIVGNEDRGN